MADERTLDDDHREKREEAARIAEEELAARQERADEQQADEQPQEAQAPQPKGRKGGGARQV